MNAKLNQPILLVEDSDEDFEALRRMFKHAALPNPLLRCVDGDDALDFLQRNGQYAGQPATPQPAIILLDLNLPTTDGREVLQQIKQNAQLKSIPLVIMTTSSNPRDIEICYQHGANSYMVKPVGTVALKQSIQWLCTYWFQAVVLP